MSRFVKNAEEAFRMLNGIFTIYKPAGIHYLDTKKTLNLNLQRDVNKLTQRPLLKHISINGPTNKEMSVVVRDSYADNPLVVGPRYIEQSFKMISINNLDQNSSGIVVLAINAGRELGYALKQYQWTKIYKLKGILGQQREDNFASGRILEKSTWKHIKRENIDRICAAMQASHQKMMFELSGVDIQSQEAYNLAIKGPIRPKDRNVPMIYSIKCTNFEPPEFKLEIVCINETPEYLKSVVAEIGIKLRSTAHCNYLQCSQYGAFNVKDTLLSKHWDLPNILDNISLCQSILSKHSQFIYERSDNLIEQIT